MRFEAWSQIRKAALLPSGLTTSNAGGSSGCNRVVFDKSSKAFPPSCGTRALISDKQEKGGCHGRAERLRIADGLVFTIEPFLSLGTDRAMDSSRDQWTLLAQPSAPTVQYEQTMVAMPRGAVVVMPLTGLEALL